MASPQKEDGYTPIANEIMEHLAKLYLSSQEWRVLIAILRKTYGYNKKEDTISLSQLAKITGMDRRHVHRAIGKLSPKQVIVVTHTGDSRHLTYCFQKDYTKWCHPYGNSQVVTHTGDKTVTHMGTHKRKKENIKEKTINQKNGFHKFYDAYPLKKGKAQALKTWIKLHKQNTLPPIDIILTAIQNQITEKQYLINNKKFCPEWKHPSTWLNSGCWDDEITKPHKPDLEYL